MSRCRVVSRRKKALNWQIFHEDCIKGLRALPEASADLVFADPPYNIGYQYNTYKDEKKDGDYLAWCLRWLEEVYRVTAKHGTFWLAIGDEWVSELDCAAKSLGFHKRSHVLWYYTFGVCCTKNFARSHTHLLYYTKAKTKFTFRYNDPKVRVPSARQLVYHDRRANKEGKLPDNTWILSPFELKKCFSNKEDTWLESRIAGTFHERAERGTTGVNKGCPQMPLLVMDRIILSCSDRGDLVVDPFGGTFATGSSALRTGRRFIGFDIDTDYCAKGYRRLENIAPARRIKLNGRA